MDGGNDGADGGGWDGADGVVGGTDGGTLGTLGGVLGAGTSQYIPKYFVTGGLPGHVTVRIKVSSSPTLSPSNSTIPVNTL